MLHTNVAFGNKAPDKHTGVSWEVSGYSFVCHLKVSFYLCEYITTSETLEIFLQPIDRGNNVLNLRKVSVYSPENECIKLRHLKKSKLVMQVFPDTYHLMHLLAFKDYFDYL